MAVIGEPRFLNAGAIEGEAARFIFLGAEPDHEGRFNAMRSYGEANDAWHVKVGGYHLPTEPGQRRGPVVGPAHPELEKIHDAIKDRTNFPAPANADLLTDQQLEGAIKKPFWDAQATLMGEAAHRGHPAEFSDYEPLKTEIKEAYTRYAPEETRRVLTTVQALHAHELEEVSGQLAALRSYTYEIATTNHLLPERAVGFNEVRDRMISELEAREARLTRGIAETSQFLAEMDTIAARIGAETTPMTVEQIVARIGEIERPPLPDTPPPLPPHREPPDMRGRFTDEPLPGGGDGHGPGGDGHGPGEGGDGHGPGGDGHGPGEGGGGRRPPPEYPPYEGHPTLSPLPGETAAPKVPETHAPGRFAGAVERAGESATLAAERMHSSNRLLVGGTIAAAAGLSFVSYLLKRDNKTPDKDEGRKL